MRKVWTEQEINLMNMQTLAFVGDGVHTLFVRENVAVLKNLPTFMQNKECAKFCKAQKQAEVLEVLQPTLTEYEQNLVRRTRNVKTNNIAKNATGAIYKKATCFEALIGYLYLIHNMERLNEFLQISIQE